MFGFGRQRREDDQPPGFGSVDVPEHRVAAVLQDHLAGTVSAECVSLGDGSVALVVEDGACEPLERVLAARSTFASPSAFARALHERVDVETLTAGDGAAGSCTVTATFHRPTSAVVRLNVRAHPGDIPALRAWAAGCLVFAMRRSDLFVGERPYDVGLVLGGLQPSPSIQAVVDHLATFEAFPQPPMSPPIEEDVARLWIDDIGFGDNTDPRGLGDDDHRNSDDHDDNGWNTGRS